jgi:hypothetical protein
VPSGALLSAYCETCGCEQGIVSSSPAPLAGLCEALDAGVVVAEEEARAVRRPYR